MMAMGTMSPKVVESGVDFTGLGHWCWMRVGLGTKKTRIVIANQPCNSGQSAGTTVKDQLLVWKQVDQDIVLLGDFNKNVYTGRIARQLSQDDLNLTKICHRHTGVMNPPTF